MAISATMRKTLPYDPAKDLSLIAFLGRIPFVLVVNPSLPVHSVADLVKWAKQPGNKPTYASGGPGSPHHLLMEMLQLETGLELIHVPYKGSAPALTDVVAGHVPMMFSDTVPCLPLVREGKVRALGVSTAIRLPSAPDIPTVAEAGAPGYDAAGWSILAAPAKTPQAIIMKIHEAAKQVLALRDVQEQLIETRHDPGREPTGEASRLRQCRDRALGQDRAGRGIDGDRVAAPSARAQRGAAAIPAAGAVAVDVVALLGDHHGVFQLDEAATRMRSVVSTEITIPVSSGRWASSSV
jgi:hypothetical protein